MGVLPQDFPVPALSPLDSTLNVFIYQYLNYAWQEIFYPRVTKLRAQTCSSQEAFYQYAKAHENQPCPPELLA